MACPSSMASERKPPELTPSTTFDNISTIGLRSRLFQRHTYERQAKQCLVDRSPPVAKNVLAVWTPDCQGRPEQFVP